MEIKCDNYDEPYDDSALQYTLRLTPKERSIMEAALHDYHQYIRSQKEYFETLTLTDSVDETKRKEGIAFYAEQIKTIEEMQKARC